MILKSSGAAAVLFVVSAFIEGPGPADRHDDDDHAKDHCDRNLKETILHKLESSSIISQMHTRLK